MSRRERHVLSHDGIGPADMRIRHASSVPIRSEEESSIRPQRQQRAIETGAFLILASDDFWRVVGRRCIRRVMSPRLKAGAEENRAGEARQIDAILMHHALHTCHYQISR